MTTSPSFAQMANNQSISLLSALRANTPPTKGQTTSRKFLTLSIFFRLLLVMFLTLTVSAEVWGAEGDTHDFPQSLSQLLNNNASVASIEIAEQSYTIKTVKITSDYNKTAGGVTMEVFVGGISWGTATHNSNAEKTFTFSGTSTKGKVTIKFTNNCGSGTGKGTFKVTTVQLVEGASASATKYKVTFNAGSGTCGTSSLTESTAGYGVTLPTATICDGWEFAGWATSSVATETTTAPTLLSEGSNYKPTGNCTLYAVYQRTEETEGNGGTENVSRSYTFSNFTAGTQYADNEVHKLDNDVTLTTTDCHFTSELRIYSSSTYNGYVVSNNLPGRIVSIGFNAGNKVDAIDVFGSTNGTNWTKVGQVSVTSTSYKDYTLNFGATNYTYFKLDVAGSNQVRLKSITITWESASAGGTITTTYYHSTPDCGPTCTDPALAYATATITKTVGDAAFTNPLTNGKNVSVTYTSTNTNVATVDNVGQVTIKAVGETTIKATWDGSTNYCADEASYTLTVNPKTYTITVAKNISNGYISADKSSAVEGATIKLTATPNTGYKLDTWNVKDASNNSVSVNANGEFTMPASNVTVSATFVSLPKLATPTNLGADNITTTSATLTWEWSDNENSQYLNGYNLYYKKVGDANFTGPITCNSKSSTRNGLTPNTEYVFKVAATSNNINECKSSEQSAEFTFKTKDLTQLAKPTNLPVTNITCTEATLSWDAVTNKKNYKLTYTDGVSTKEVTTGSESVTLNNLLSGTTYTWEIQAIGDGTNYANSEVADGGSFTTNYKITYNVKGGTWTACADGCVAGGEDFTICSTEPSKDGCNFVGWSTADDTEVEYQAGGTINNVSANTTLYAVWEQKKYTVNWYVNSTSKREQTGVVGAALTDIPEPTTVDCDNSKVFVGWTTIADYSDATDAPDGMITNTTGMKMPEGGATYYAVFATAEGGGGSVDYSSTHTSNVPINAGTAITNTNVIIESKEYAATKAGTGSASGSVDVTIPAGTTQLSFHMAGWNGEGGKTITLTGATADPSSFKTIADAGVSGNGKYTLSGDVAQYAYSTTLTNITQETKITFANNGADQRFVIWGVNASTGVSYSDYTTTCDNTKATITYNLNGGTGATCGKTIVTKDVEFSLCNQTPTKTGYDFVGWTDGVNTYNAGASTSVTDNTKFYAAWIAKTIKITWDQNYTDCPVSETSKYIYDGEDIEMPEDPIRTGYKFTGWYTASTDGTKITEVGTTNKPTDDVTYYAHWNELYSVTFMVSGQVYVVQEDKYLSGANLELPADPSPANYACDGYIFDGWSVAEKTIEEATKPELITNPTITKDEIYYAVWKKATTEGAGETIFYESFNDNDADGGNDGKFNTASNTEECYVDNEGWEGNKFYEADQCIKLGGSSAKGYITTPKLSQLSGNATLSFKAAAWENNSEQTDLVLSITGGGTLDKTSVTMIKGAWKTYEVTIKDGTSATRITFAGKNTSNSRFFLDEVKVTTSGGYNYTTLPSCGPTIVAKEGMWVTSSNGQSVKINVPIAVKSFTNTATITGTSTNENFVVTPLENVSNGINDVVEVIYTPTTADTKEETTITLTAKNGEEILTTTTFTLNGRSLPDEFVIVAQYNDKWLAVPANMQSGADQYNGIEVTPDNALTQIPAAPSTTIYSLRGVADNRYEDAGTCVRLVGNGNKCLWGNAASTNTTIQNWTTLGATNGSNYEWLLTTSDGELYTIANPEHPDYDEGRILSNSGSKYGLYKGTTKFYILPVGCSSQPGNIQVTARRVDATFSWEGSASSMKIDVYTNDAMTEVNISNTATASPYYMTGLSESTQYWFKMTPNGTDNACAYTGSFKTTGPTIDVVEWQENAAVIFVDKDKGLNPVVVIDGEVEHGVGATKATDIFFSKYFEAQGTAKLLAIYNGTANAISLADITILQRSMEKNIPLSLANYGKTKGWIQPSEEIILYNVDAREEVMKCAEEDDTFESWNNVENSNLAFSGKGTIRLFRGNKCIDIIGAMESAEDIHDKKVTPLEGTEEPTFGDELGFTTATGDNYSTPNVETNYTLSTNRCLLVRKPSVTSGAIAVEKNIGDFKTLGNDYDGIANEWAGLQVPNGPSDNKYKYTCEGFQKVGSFDYNQYYKEYQNVQPEKVLDEYKHNADTKEYIIPIENLAKYSCLNIRFQLKKGDQVLTEEPVQVPIIVSDQKATNDAIFNAIVKTNASEPVYDQSIERCKTCNVVVLSDATLTKATDGTKNDVAEVANLKIYPGGQVVVPAETNYTVNSLAFRRQEDEVSMANIQGKLNVKHTNGVYLDVRIDPSNWHYMTLPYDCRVGDVTFADGTPAVVNTDYLLGWYDGAYRAEHKTGGWTYITDNDYILKKGLGYIVALPGDGKVRREIRFPMANDVIAQDLTSKTVSGLYAYGGDKTDAELRPNHKGWNMIGSPYLYTYTTDIVKEPLQMGTLEHSPVSPWDGTWVRTGDARYIVEPIDNGWSGYRQTTISNLKPFTSYFIQVGGVLENGEYTTITPETEQQIEFAANSVARNASAPRKVAEAEVTDNHPVWYGVEMIAPNNEKDNTTLLISNEFTDGYDMMDDLVKMRGDYYQYYNLPVLASNNNEGEMAFNALPDSSAAKIGVPLSYYAATAGTYTIATDGRFDLEEVKAAMLYDATTAQYTNLLTENYSFTTNKGNNTNRFTLFVTVERKKVPNITTGMDNLLANGQLSLIAVERTLVLSGLTENADIYVYDMSGKMVTGTHSAGENGIWRTTVPATGVYFVRVNSANSQQTLRTIVK